MSVPASTSTPTDAVLPPEPVCPECHTEAGAGWFRRDVPVGHPDFGKPLRCQHPFHAAARAVRLQTVSQLGPEDIKRRLSDIRRNADNGAMLDAAQVAVERGYGWLYIWGGPGNAKSEVLKAVVNQLNETGRGPAIYSTLGNITDFMRQSFGKNTDEDFLSRFNRLKLAPVLAIAEMDKPSETDWMQDFRFHFLDSRYIAAVNRQALTVFAGNRDPRELGDVLWDRISDGRFAVVHNAAPSARRGMRW